MSGGGLDPHYDFALLGTSLPISILSAALSRAGFTVLHVDEEEHYGGPWSSLTLSELVEWARNQALHRSQGRQNVSIEFPAFPSSHGRDGEIPQELAALNRHFSISLVPTILPCAGPTIDVLIRSKVASYCTFRLLQKTAVYSTSARGSTKWPLRKVPSSKEDIFKDKELSLVDKRRLMKLLQEAAAAASSSDLEKSTEGTQQIEQPESIMEQRFMEHLTSKEGRNLSEDLAASIAYGVALCSSDQDTTNIAMERIRRHITSIGRYGNSAYLVGQYGGAGEMAQCFCRASAVQGGTFVLGHRIGKISSTKHEEGASEGDTSSSNWILSLEGIEGSTQVERVVIDEHVHKRVFAKDKAIDQPESSVHNVSGILLLDRGIPFEDPASATSDPSPETGLVIFPPEDAGNIGAVTALQMAEGTFSCPKGMYLIHLTALIKAGVEGALDARTELKRARDHILRLATRSNPEWKSDGVATTLNNGVIPLMECYYSSVDTHVGEKAEREGHLWSIGPEMHSLATSLDGATTQAERLFWDLIGREKRTPAEAARRKRRPVVGYAVGRGLGGALEREESEYLCDFFPNEDASGGDEEDG